MATSTITFFIHDGGVIPLNNTYVDILPADKPEAPSMPSIESALYGIRWRAYIQNLSDWHTFPYRAEVHTAALNRTYRGAVARQLARAVGWLRPCSICGRDLEPWVWKTAADHPLCDNCTTLEEGIRLDVDLPNMPAYVAVTVEYSVTTAYITR